MRAPNFLTFLHSLWTFFGCACDLIQSDVKLKTLSWRDTLLLAMSSCLFTVNIAISNVSLSVASWASIVPN